MYADLGKYAGKRICAAVSGGRDSMALLHYLCAHADEYEIEVCALNCDHGIRGEESARDSAFVAAYCGGKGIKLHFFKAEDGELKDENSARLWRLGCYKKVIDGGFADCVATAHHLNDNAETVLFNLARGASVSGVCGIGDEPSLNLIRPLIACSREEIDSYVRENAIPYVTDSTNFQTDYTRNKIRLSVLPELESAVHGAAEAIYRFSRLAREDEEYLSRLSDGITICRSADNYLIKFCPERVIFKRAAARIISDKFKKCDYTAAQLERLFLLQSGENGKKFSFLSLTAVREEGGVAISGAQTAAERLDFSELLKCGRALFAGSAVRVERSEFLRDMKVREESGREKTLYFDIDKIPTGAVVRRREAGDKFTKFGGGTVSLSDYLTDKKVPQSMRANLPLLCAGKDVLIVGGVEISEKVKLSEGKEKCGAFICANPFST